MERLTPVSPALRRSPTVTLMLLVFLLSIVSSVSSQATPGNTANNSSLEAQSTKPFLLRVMPLGASITFGYTSTGKDGYREWLRKQLRFAGWEVDMVGSLKIGTMKDNDNEGHYAYRIDQIAEAVEKSTNLQPNLILLNAGTNDALQSYDINSAGDRIDDLLTQLFTAINGTTIILSTLIPNTQEPGNVADINEQYRQVAATRRAQGDRVVLAEMSDFIKESQLVDGIHPTDYGYKEMASVWWAAIQEAEREGLLQPPNPVGGNALSVTIGEDLDDSVVEDPGLPDYTAPPQPLVKDGSGVLRSGERLVVGFQVLGKYFSSVMVVAMLIDIQGV